MAAEIASNRTCYFSGFFVNIWLTFLPRILQVCFSCSSRKLLFKTNDLLSVPTLICAILHVESLNVKHVSFQVAVLMLGCGIHLLP